MWSKKILGVDPVPVPPHVFEVDGRHLRYGRFTRNGTGFELDTFVSKDLDAELFAPGPLGGLLHDPERFRAALANLQGSLEEAAAQASLVLPDPWLRLAIVEGEELPRAPGARDEVLRWKLQRIVPFRVEELRVRGVETGPGSRFDRSRKVLLGFALDTLLNQLEGAFAQRGVDIGLVTNQSLALLSGIGEALRDVELGAVAYVSRSGYSLSFVLRGEPVLHRFKALPQISGDQPPIDLVRRDLRLTEAFLREQIDGAPVGRALVVSPSDLEERWIEWLGDAFELPVHPLRLEHLPLVMTGVSAPLHQVATLLGAARQEVA